MFTIRTVGSSERRRVDARGSDRVHRPVLPFFVLAFVWTWALWWTAAATGRSFTDPAGFMLFMTGGLGPLVGAVWVVHRRGHAYRRAFLRRVWDPRQIPMPWWLALLAVTTLPAVLGAALASVAGASATVPDYSVGLVLAAVVSALAAGLVEEPGWRGAASDACQEQTRPVWAALGIGVVWSFWHLPLSFFEGTYFHGLGFGSVQFWLTHLMLVQLGVLYVWLANGSGGSILIAVLAHAGFNTAWGQLPGSTTGAVITFLVLTAATVAVIAATKGGLCFAGADGSMRPTTVPTGDDEVAGREHQQARCVPKRDGQSPGTAGSGRTGAPEPAPRRDPCTRA